MVFSPLLLLTRKDSVNRSIQRLYRGRIPCGETSWESTKTHLGMWCSAAAISSIATVWPKVRSSSGLGCISLIFITNSQPRILKSSTTRSRNFILNITARFLVATYSTNLSVVVPSRPIQSWYVYLPFVVITVSKCADPNAKHLWRSRYYWWIRLLSTQVYAVPCLFKHGASGFQILSTISTSKFDRRGVFPKNLG